MFCVRPEEDTHAARERSYDRLVAEMLRVEAGVQYCRGATPCADVAVACSGVCAGHLSQAAQRDRKAGSSVTAYRSRNAGVVYYTDTEKDERVRQALTEADAFALPIAMAVLDRIQHHPFPRALTPLSDKNKFACMRVVLGAAPPKTVIVNSQDTDDAHERVLQIATRYRKPHAAFTWFILPYSLGRDTPEYLPSIVYDQGMCYDASLGSVKSRLISCFGARLAVDPLGRLAPTGINCAKVYPLGSLAKTIAGCALDVDAALVYGQTVDARAPNRMVFDALEARVASTRAQGRDALCPCKLCKGPISGAVYFISCARRMDLVCERCANCTPMCKSPSSYPWMTDHYIATVCQLPPQHQPAVVNKEYFDSHRMGELYGAVVVRDLSPDAFVVANGGEVSLVTSRDWNTPKLCRSLAQMRVYIVDRVSRSLVPSDTNKHTFALCNCRW
jgi:hypothetical protein